MSINLSRSGINSEIKCPFRWYANPLLKNKFKRTCKKLESTCGYRLLTPPTRLLSFQFYRETSLATIVSWEIFNMEDVLVETLDENLLTIIPITDTDEPCDYIIYAGDDLGLSLDSNYYYSLITDSDGNSWYSEDFYVFGIGTFANILENGNFDDGDLGWTLEEAVVSDGMACFNSPAFLPRSIQHDVDVISGRTYKVGIQFDTVTGTGNLLIYLGAGSPVTIVDPVAGYYSVDVVAGAGGYINIAPSSPLVGCVDFITVGEIAQEGSCNGRLVWSNSCQWVGNMFYPEGYVNEFWLDVGVEPISPVVNVIREYDENGNKEKILRRQRRETIYNLQVGMIPWFVADALAEMSLNDEIRLELANNLGDGEMLQVDVDIDWQDFGNQCLAMCDINFQLDDATVTDGCCDGDVIPPPQICTEKFCDPDLDLILSVIADFSIEGEDNVSTTPIIGSGCTWDGNQLCTDTALPDNTTFYEFEKNILSQEKYYFRFTIDSISGSVNIYKDGIIGALYSGVGTYEVWITPEPFVNAITITFKTVGSTELCMTFEAFAIWIPCLTPEAETYGWVGEENGLIYTGGSGGDGRLTCDVAISSNFTYAIEIDYEIPVTDDCLEIWIAGVNVSTITNDPDPASGTFSFNYDPRTYGIARNQNLQIILIPCSVGDSIIGLSGIRFCGLLY